MLVVEDTTGEVTGVAGTDYIQEFGRASMYLMMAMVARCVKAVDL